MTISSSDESNPAKRARQSDNNNSEAEGGTNTNMEIDEPINENLDKDGDSPGPPLGHMTLGFYFEQKWLKEGLTDQEKDDFQFDFNRKIDALRRNSDICKGIQRSLKIDLNHFLKTGQEMRHNKSAESTPGRVAAIDYDIESSSMLYKRDVVAFKKRVEELQKWKHEGKDEYMAPYFPLIQSSGTGKTKLMHECKELFKEHDDHIHCELVLCQRGDTPQLENVNDIFSKFLDATEYSVGDIGRKELCRWLDDLLKVNEKKDVVLFFDEAQHLIKDEDGWHFRVIRWWLRIQERKENVVGVFAATNTSLANYFVERKRSNTSRNVAGTTYNEGKRLYPPFYEITTTGLFACTNAPQFEPIRSASAITVDRTDGDIEFDEAVQYGRPLFARMHRKGQLQKALRSILSRMRGGAQHASTLEGDFSILAARLQMGQVSFDVATRQVASGYAYLTHLARDNNTTVVEIAYLPDPVCAWLAMTQMIEKCSLCESAGGIPIPKSQHPSVWSEKAIKMYSTGLCRPEKADAGEVAAVFYMLACGDELRWEQSTMLTKLSVPLEMWIARLQGDGKSGKKTSSACTGDPTVNFIQVCRNYLRHNVKEIQESGLLQHWYRGARASYAYAACPAYDLLIPVKYRHGNDDHYCPMLVSVKNRLSYTDKQRKAAIDAMKSVLKEVASKAEAEDASKAKPVDETKAESEGAREAKSECASKAESENAAKEVTGMCMLLLIGLDECPSSLSQNETSFEFSHGDISTIVVEVPSEDPFGATNLALCPTCGGGQKSEVMVSHPEVALGAKANFTRLLRSKTAPGDPSVEFLEDIKSHYLEVSKCN